MSKNYYLGIDLGGTTIKAGVVDEEYNVLGMISDVKTPFGGDQEKLTDAIILACEKSIAKSGVDAADIQYVGIGMPGTADTEQGVLKVAVNLGLNADYPVCRDIRAHLGKDTYAENDANAAAYGELIAGVGKGNNIRDMVCVTLGTGVGAGIIVDGRILHGCNYAAGEFGHTVIVAGGEACGCGRFGCFEKYASASALAVQTRRAMQVHPDSLMWKKPMWLDDISGIIKKGGPTDEAFYHETEQIDMNDVNGQTAFIGMYRGDAAAKQVVNDYIRYLAVGLTNLINTFQPEVLCIGGSISKERDRLTKLLEKRVEHERFSQRAERQTRICAAEQVDKAGIIGAAYLWQLYAK